MEFVRPRSSSRSPYRGLQCGRAIALPGDGLTGLLVRPDVALRQQEAEAPKPLAGGTIRETPPPLYAPGSGKRSEPPPPIPKPAVVPKRFHGTVSLNPTRVGLDASRIADEVVSHLAGLLGSTVKVTLEIEAEIPSGAPDTVVRTL